MSETPSQRRFLIGALGTTQILAWGSSYYLPAVLAGPTSADTGWPLPWVVGGLSAGLLVAGLASTVTGRLIQRYGGRPVLSASSVLLALALMLMAAASTYPAYLSAWLLMGLGMSAGLYDAGFSTLGRLYGVKARSAITTLTLFGGFASTICWPLSAYLVEAYGWRGACLCYAAIHLFICLPLHFFAVPSVARSALDRPTSRPASAEVATEREKRAFALLALVLTLAALIASMVSVHLLAVLQARGLDLATAVALGALIGPAQVGARVAEMAIGRNRHHPVWTMLASVALLASGLGLLLFSLPLTAMALILYGAGNGIHTIARGALPLILFDPQRYPALMGKLAMPSQIAQAAAPSIGAVLIGYGEGAMLGVLFTVALLNVALVVVLAWLSGPIWG